MPVITSRLNKSALQTAYAVEANLCNANVVLQNALQKLGPDVRNSFRLRCDELPFVFGNEENLETVFSAVMQLIVERKDTATKLYLHIGSTTGNEESSAIALSKEIYQFSIQFHTNITPCSEWTKLTEQKISNLTALLAPSGGSLTINPLKNSGCILTVSLPGKL